MGDEKWKMKDERVNTYSCGEKKERKKERKNSSSYNHDPPFNPSLNPPSSILIPPPSHILHSPLLKRISSLLVI